MKLGWHDLAVLTIQLTLVKMLFRHRGREVSFLKRTVVAVVRPQLASAFAKCNEVKTYFSTTKLTEPSAKSMRTLPLHSRDVSSRPELASRISELSSVAA